MWYFFYVLFVGGSVTLYYLKQERLSIGVVVLVVVMGFFDWFRKKHTTGEIMEVGSYEWSFVNKENKEERRPSRPDDVLHNVIPFPDYIEEKANGNCYIAGQAGMGKTALLEFLVELYDNPKLILSSKVMKEEDRDFELGYNWISMETHLPDPFRDKEACAKAFSVTFAIERAGIMADSVQRIAETILRGSSNWAEVRAELKKLQNSGSGFRGDILQTILDRIESLEGKGEAVVIDYDKNNVLDFSKLNDTAKTFYMELMLRQIDNESKTVRQGKTPVIVVIDEAHRLADGDNPTKAKASILNIMVRESRLHLKIFCASQNITDIYEDIRANFGSVFSFRTRHEKDMTFLEKISDNMKECVTNLKQREFVDVMQEGQNRRISIMFADMSIVLLKKRHYAEKRLKTSSPSVKTEAKIESTPESPKESSISDTFGGLKPEEKVYDYEKRVLELLERKPENISQLALIISKETGEIQDAVKLKLRNKVIPRLVDKDSISSMPLVTHKFKGKRTPVYYFKNDKQLSNFHVLMTDLVKKECQKTGVEILKEAYVGIQSCDLETKSQLVEVESGLKHSYTDLIERITKAVKPVIVVVPNLEVLLRYEDKLKDQLNKCVITTLADLKDKLIKD